MNIVLLDENDIVSTSDDPEEDPDGAPRRSNHIFDDL